jgi:CheY-like chemotaxis protein
MDDEAAPSLKIDEESHATQHSSLANVDRRRILVVDDNLDSAESLTVLLDLAGNETRAAYDGVEALEAAFSFRPHVILLDIGLPELNGYEVARQIREHPWSKDMVLIALTGWGQEADRRRSQDAGIHHHFTKPVDPTALKKLLATLPQSTTSKNTEVFSSREARDR